MNIKNLLIRSLSGACYVGAIVGFIFWGEIPFACFFVAIGWLAIFELHKMCTLPEERFNSMPVLIIDLLTMVCIAFAWLYIPLVFWIFLFICRLVLELYLKKPNPIKCLAQSLMGQLYIGIPLACLFFIGHFFGLHLVLAAFLMIWISDTGAFLVGCTLGKHRLFERVSPKKSWEGFLGGLSFNLIAGWLFCIGGNHFWLGREAAGEYQQWNVITWLIFALVVTVFATLGDLVESLLKRSLNVKDSGHIIPGHGGILDRIDSLLLVFPAVMIFLFIDVSIHPYLQKFYFPFLFR